MTSDMLENKMIEVEETVKPTASNIEDNDEDEKQEEEETKEVKKEEKKLYDIQYVYRTYEKRLIKQPENYTANSFGLKDKIGEGVNVFLHAFYDPNLDSGTVTIRNGQNVIGVLQKTLAELKD